MTPAPESDSELDEDRLDACEVLLDRYRAALRDRSDDSSVAEARESWRAFVGEHHGPVFGRLANESTSGSRSATEPLSLPDDADDVAREVFVRTLSFDFLLSTLSAAAEREFSVDVASPRSSTSDGDGSRSDSTPDLLAAFDAVHEAVRPGLSSAVRTDATEADEAADAFVRESDPAVVAELHRRTVPRAIRRAFGRYDTPAGLAELAVESVRPDGTGEFDDALVLDPGCGAGAFLVAAARAKFDSADADANPSALAARVADSVRGFDVNPVAVRASRLALVLACRPLLRRDGVDSFAPRVALADATETTAEDAPLNGTRADVLLGNPPWLTWDSLTPRVKDRWREGPMADSALDLFPHRGREARLGHANDDLSVPYVWTCLHRLLRDGGRAAFVLKCDLMTGPAGELLRRRRVGDRSLAMRRVHDFGSLSPFGREVDAGTALYRLDVGGAGSADASDDSAAEKPAAGPDTADVEIPATRWSRADVTPAFGSLSDLRRTLAAEETAFVAADPTTEASPWIRADAERGALGPSEYRIRHGVKDDAKAVYALDRETIEAHDVEPDHVYPYLKSKHVVKYGLFGHGRLLVPQRRAGEDNEATLRRETPNTYAYLDANRERLESRGSSWFDGGPFYSLFGLGPYTWADYKVVWCRLGYKPHFAVVSTVEDPLLGEKPVVPGDHCMFVGTDEEREAHYLCGLLNSAPYQRCLRDISSGGKSSLSKSTVSRLAMPEWEGTERQAALAEASMDAHEIVPDHVDCSKRAYNAKTVPELDAAQARVDRLAERFLAAREDQ